ncbi:lipopolysaccharide biosynthesis protein [Fulvimonas sp. R45]|uniref:lipopolysaccharide biosynthesis protein n=1 Tax=Fulvimonas sp. R45 TaxID=3045937 RepID=UPI0026601D76|nr:lipopolysaccharide biosynthesis protein [Fulvimonas sp. R45]MDO1527788.1 lipopolysaccharide biosynthesis protein [Fulvimonas sp. R45]
MASLTHRAAYATWWSALEIASRYGVQLLVLAILARLLVPADFGLIAMLQVFTSVAVLLVDSGFGMALVQKQDTSDDDETTVLLSGLGISILAGIALWLVAPAIAHFYSQPLLTPLTRLLLFVLPLSALAAVPDALLTQRLDFRSRANAEIFASLGSGSLAVLLAWHGFGVWSLAWQSIMAIGVRATLLWLYSHWRPRGRFCISSFRRLFAFGSYMLMANLLNTLSIRMQSLLIGRLFDSRALGYYTIAQNTQQAPAQFMSNVLNRVGLPVFSTVADQPAKLIGALRLSLRVAIFVFVPCMLGMAMIAKPLIVVLYGPRWMPAAPLLSILAAAAMFWPLHVLNLAAIGARGRSDLFFKLEVAKRAISIVLIVIASFHSVLAVAWAVLISSLCAVVINTWYSKKLLGYGIVAQLGDQLGTLALSAVAALIGWLVLHYAQGVKFDFLFAIVAAAATYIAGAIISRQRALRDLAELMRALYHGNPASSSLTEK